MKPPKHLSLIEPLEARIAPAIILNPYTVTYQDENGNTAVIKISKPLFTNATAAGKILEFTSSTSSTTVIQESYANNSTSEYLSAINLLGRTDASGMDISVALLPQAGIGTFTVDVGAINAANFGTPNQVSQNIDLGSINIQGNLGSITAGASNYFFKPSIQSLTVDSMTSALYSDVLGPIGSFVVKGNFNANLSVIGYQFGSIGKLYIGGNLTYDSNDDQYSGEISFTGSIGTATIGNIIGGASANTGVLEGSQANPSHIGSLTVTGSTGIQGGSNNDTGLVFAEAGIGKINIAGSLTGGAGNVSGQIGGPIGNVNIGGNVVGGSGLGSGTIFSEYSGTSGTVNVGIGNVTIGGNLQGGNAGSTGSAGDSGIISATTAKTITIGGSLIGGTSSSSSQDADTSGVIMVNSVQNLIILGNVTGGSGANSGLITGQSGFLTADSYGHILISGGVTGGSGTLSGAINLTGLVQSSIASLHIGGSVTGGSATQSGYINAGTKIGALSVGGSIIGGTASNTGEIVTGGTLTQGLVGGKITGGTVDSPTAVLDAGYIQAHTITSLEIKGGITSGANTGTGGIASSGAIRATQNIASLAIDGTVTGTATNPVVVSALQGTRVAKTDLAISSLTFQGNVSYLDVLAGYSPPTAGTAASAPLGTGGDGTAQIGAVTFAGNLSATNVVAGVTGVSNGAKYPPAGQFGTASDAAISSGGVSGLYSTIAKIVIAGTATGDSTSGDSFGFVAQEVVAVSVGAPAVPVALHSGPNNDHLIPVSGNLYVNEAPPA